MSIHSKITNKATFDGWNNVLNGLGGEKDITTTSEYAHTSYKTLLRFLLNSLYSQNWIAAKTIDIPIDDALKDDRDFTCEDAEQLKEFKEQLSDFEIDDKIDKLARWAKVFGSAVMVIVSNDDEMDKPFVMETMRKGSLKNIVVLDRFDIYSTILNRDPLSKRYLKPDYYSISKGSQRIHHSRVIQLDGVTTTNFDKEVLQGFGLSTFERLYDVIMRANMSPQLLINLLNQSNLDVYNINGLNDALEDGEDSLVTKRLQVLQKGKSIFNGLALDKEDTYTNISKNFSGLGDLNKEFYQIVAGASDIPFSRFMGASLNGLNPTGNGEMNNYYDKVIAERKRLNKVYDTLDKIIMMNTFGQLLEYEWEFPSLFQMSDDERSIINNRDAQTREIDLRNGLVNEMEAKAQLIENDMYPTITAESYQEELELYSSLENEGIEEL